MKWKVISFSEVNVPLKPYKPGYVLLLVENQKGEREIAQAEKGCAGKISIGILGDLKTAEVFGREIRIFSPDSKDAPKKSNKVALVTGSSRGIGRAIALELAGCGYDIVINSDKTGTEGVEVVSEVENMGRIAVYIAADVSRSEHAQDMIEKTIEKFGRLDLLVNNAGITLDKRIADMSQEQWEKVLAVNLTGAFNCSKQALKHMQSNGAGKIINISSVVGEMGNIGQANYAASKGGLISFTKTIAREYAEYGITANAIAPGFIKTKMVEAMPKPVLAKKISQIPLGRLGLPEEVAKLVSFLASEDADYITGQVININGGLYM